MPSTLKRPSLVRLLASLCPPPSRASSFPVQPGFPTSLADLVVRNHGRLRKPRKPRHPAAATAPVSPPSPVVTVEELPLSLPPSAQPLSPVAVRRLDAAPRLPDDAAVFRLRPELLAVGGAVALALLAVWSEGTVAAFTVAALSLLWIESASRRPRPTEYVALLNSCGRGPVLPIQEAEEAPRTSCSDSDKGSAPASPRSTAERRELVAAPGAGGDEPTTPPKRKRSRKSLRKLISKKLQKKPKSKDSSSTCDGEANQPETAAGDNYPVQKTESLVPFPAEQTPSESSIEWSSSSSEAVVDRRGPGVKFPLLVFVPVILAGLAAGKLPATALAVLCVAFFSGAVQRL